MPMPKARLSKSERQQKKREKEWLFAQWRKAIRQRILELLDHPLKDMPHGYLAWPECDVRFDTLLLGQLPVTCAGTHVWQEQKRFMAFGRRVSFTATRHCRRKVIIRTRGLWYCAKCIQAQPLPLWERSPELHMRPAPHTVGWYGPWPRRASYGKAEMEQAPEDFVLMGQNEVERYLECDADVLWIAVTQGNLDIARGGEHEPYKFYKRDVDKFGRYLNRDVVSRLVGSHAEALGR